MLTVTLISLLCSRMVFSAVPSTFDVVTNVGGVDIGWIEIFSCPERSSGSTQTFANGKTAADYFQYFNDAIAVQLLPIDTTPTDYNFDSPTNEFAVMTGVCSVPVVALNNNLDLSWPIDPNTLTNPGFTADITYINNNYLGTDTARSRYVQGDHICQCQPRDPTKIFDSTNPDGDYYMYWACCNHGGVHLTRDQCSLDYQTDLPGLEGITLFLGFDYNRMSKCCVDSNINAAELSTQCVCDSNMLGVGCEDDSGCPECMQCCPKNNVCEYPPDRAESILNSINEMNNDTHGVSTNVYQYPMYGYILLIGVILFVLINNLFIGYYCVCKKNNATHQNEQYEKCDIVVDDE